MASELSLARYSAVAVYANNSVINFNLVGEGFEGAQITHGGALECHTDDTTCCRGIDNPPNGTGGESGTILMGLLFYLIVMVLISTEQEITWLSD